MRTYLSLATILGAALLCGMNYGCQTNEPGATYTLNTYSANLDASPDKVTAAAEKAVNDLKLNAVVANGTKVDGMVTARTAQDTAVTITITQNGDNVSKMSIQVGTTGDQALSAQIMEKTKSHLKWF